MTTIHKVAVTTVFVTLPLYFATASYRQSAYDIAKECFTRNLTMLCLKEKALNVMNDIIANDKPIHLTDYMTIVKDPGYNDTLKVELPANTSERSRIINGLLVEKADEFLKSRTLKFRLGSAFEGRKKKGKYGGMMMLGAMAIAGMMGQMFMSKIAFMAGTALMMAKMALAISAIIGLKKLGSSGGTTEHVVYTTSTSGGDYGHGHGGGGGWHRSLEPPNEEALPMAYVAHQRQGSSTYQ